MSETCHKAQDIDLTLFLLEPQGSEWQEFRAHYPYCATCSAEIQKWTALEQHLRSLDNSGATAHPSAETLVQFQRGAQLLSAEARDTIAAHLRSCTTCREEVKLLESFNFSLVQEWVRETTPVVTAREEKSWSSRFWNSLHSVFFHPAFAYGLVLLLAIPFIRSYYLSSFSKVPVSSDFPSAPEPTSLKKQLQVQQEKEGRVEEGKTLQDLPPTTASAPIRIQPPAEKAKDDSPPVQLAKPSTQREDLALKDERVPKSSLPPVSPAPSISQESGARNREAPTQQKSRGMEEKERQASAELPAPSVAAEGRTGSPEMLAARKRQLETREARSTEGDTLQWERTEEGASFASPATSASSQSYVPARGTIIPEKNSPQDAFSSLTETYKNAYEARDLSALSHVWNIDLAWREALIKLFAQSRQITVSLTLNEERLTESADQRQVSVPFSQTVTAVHQDGQIATQGPFFCVADLRKQVTSTWRIHDLQEDPQHPGQCRFQ